MAAQGSIISDQDEEELRSVLMGESDDEVHPSKLLKDEEVELREVLLGSSDNEADADEMQQVLFGDSDTDPEDSSVYKIRVARAQEESRGHEHYTSEDHGREIRAASALVEMHQHERLPVPPGYHQKDVEINEALKISGSRFQLPSKKKRTFLQGGSSTGVCSIQLCDVDVLCACKELGNYLCAPENRSPHGFLLIGGSPYPGFGNYTQVLSEKIEWDPRAQEQFTSMIPAMRMPHALDALPCLKQVVKHVLQLLGLDLQHLKHVHLLHQGNPHAMFSWHDDASDLRMSRRSLSAIVSLNNCVSGMQLWGFHPAYYHGCGHVYVFPATALHRSVPPHDPPGMCCTFDEMVRTNQSVLYETPLKVALFMDYK
mmetsp:Transcript_19956/g.49758  ORF Transcript_19956/g.49758 Transcript_19956/m.49758 type:complete len:371 (+) Transcript_19956:52-1164(+)